MMKDSITVKEIEAFLQSCDIKEDTYRMDGYFTTTLRYADWSDVTQFGIMTAFGDAFEYLGKGVAILGHSGIGKTRLAKEIGRMNGCKVLAEDEILCFSKGNSGRMMIYEYPFVESDSWDDTIQRYSKFLAEESGPELNAVIHLNGEDVYDADGFVNARIDRTQEFFHTLRGKGEVEREKESGLLSEVCFLEYAKGYGYENEPKLRTTAEKVVDKLEEVFSKKQCTWKKDQWEMALR